MSRPTPSIDEIFFTAMERESPAARAAYLDEVCGSDLELRRRLERLLDAQPKVGSFLDSPAAGPTMTLPQPQMMEGPGTVIGPYKLLEQIGEGGMGIVYMAEQTEPVRRKVALKIIKPGMDTKQVIARFEAERQALAILDHPNIAKVLDAGATESGRPYFAMELVRGIPITEYCDQHRLPIDKRLDLFTRSGGFSGAVSVDVATSGGTASPGINYSPINQVVSFAAGQDSQTITIPIKDDGVATDDLTVSIVLSSPGKGALLGSPSTATLVIHNVDQTRSLPALVTVDQVEPVMNANGQVIEILVGFSGGVNANQAQKKSTFRITLAGKGGSFRARNARVIKLRSAVYKATSDMVVLDLKGHVALGEPLQLVVDGVGPSGLHDSDGRLIDGNGDGQPGSNAVAVIRPGDVTDSALSARTAAVDWLLSRPFFK